MAYSGELRRQIVYKVLKQGEAVSHVAQKYNVARKTIYKWIFLYKKARGAAKKTSLSSKYLRGANHPRSVRHKAKGLLIKFVTKNPSWGSRILSRKLKSRGITLGNHGVWRLLCELDLTTEKKREEFTNQYSGPGRFLPILREQVVMETEAGVPIARVAKKFNLSRKTVYAWIKKWRTVGKVDDLYVAGLEHPRAVSADLAKRILDIVASNPALSSHKIAPVVGLSNHGVWNILKRNNLTLYEQRVAFAQGQAQAARVPVFGWLFDRVRLVWETFVPQVAPAPPPLTFVRGKLLVPQVRLFLASTLFSSVFSLGFIWWINLLSTQPLGISIGLLFATVALLFGSFFFAYSMKYYFTLAIVLSFSQQEGINNLSAGGQTANSNGKNGRRNGGILGWILGLGNGSSSLPRGSPPAGGRRGVGLEPSLEHVVLKRHPFISVHIPFYNEKNVAERILAAVSAFDYPNYEVVVADDSTDDTTLIIQNYIKNNGVAPRSLKSGVGWTLTEGKVGPGVVLKHLHRTSRAGFKGGALREALRASSPKAEFIVVFDADFVPYPDTLELFLKYFKLQNNMSEDYKKSQVAVVQGYQWHVLNKSENWITRGVRSEYSGSYVIERSGQEILGALKMISGSVYMIRKDVLEEVGWETSITEDFELTLKLYEKGYKVVYTPYIQAPAECVSTIKRLVRQRMRWAEGHSHNIRRMFTRLLFGDWKTDDGGQKTETEDRKQMTENHPSVIGLQNPSSAFSFQSSKSQSSRTWVPSPLTLIEKLEFLYLSPYYLQAFFFLMGTLSWLISETIFPARLPFWTSLWGWSLVLTNFLALPLLNGVGLFLEEAEEKDYQGIISFVILSYILVPFQAYAAIKGFLEKEEGPWFRTPKTGKITDIFTRGRFYRLIAGILPGKALGTRVEGIVSSSLNPNAHTLNPNPYFSLATANNSFNSFTIRPRQARWLGKVALVFVLVLSMTLLSFSPLIRVGKESLDREAGLKPPELTSQKTDFKFDEEPQFILDIKEETSRKVSFVSRAAAVEFPKIEVEVYRQGKKADLPVEIEKHSDGKLVLRVKPTQEAKPGKYELRIIVARGEQKMVVNQDFTWGVLAINTNKSIYLPAEQAYLQMAALDDGGKTVCDANLELKVQNEKSKIEKSGKCGPNNVTDVPDYFAYWQVEQPGTYEMVLTNLDNGYSITDSFEVRDSVPFDIERYGPTRIYPPEAYTMSLTIKTNQDFEGVVEESVPASFEIISSSPTSEVSEDFTSEVKRISWNVNWKVGERYQLFYEFDAPNESPQFYLLGPLELATVHRSPTTIFTETRRWQIAVDQAANVYTAESLTTSSTTLTTLQNKVTLNFTPASTAEHWVVVATGEVRRNDTTADVSGDGVILGRYALSLDGTVIPVTPYAGFAGSGAGVTGGNHTAWKSFLVFKKITGFATQRTAIVQWRSESGATTEIRNARILAFRIPNEASANIQYVEALSVVSDTVNPTNALTLTWTPPSLGDYILMGQGFHHEGPGGASTGGLFWVDEGTEATNSDENYIGQNEPGVPFFHVQRKNLSAASHTFILRHKPDITSGSERFGLAILAFRADVFDNTETSEALTQTTTTSTTYQNKINFTIATAASARDHVFLGGHTPGHATSDTNDGRYGRWLLNSVEITEEAPAQIRGGYLKRQGLAWTLNTVGGIAVQAQFRSPNGVITASDAQARLVVLRYPAAGTANATQIHYRWRNDNGDEINTGDGADGALAPAGAFNLNTDESGGRTYPDGIAYRVVAPADAASSVSQFSASDDFQGIVAGDEVLLINMQGTSSDNADVGNYEFMGVQSVTSTTLTFTASITKSYDGTTASNQKVVVQRVPNYTGVTLDSTDSLTASDWDGLGSCLGGSGQSCRLTGIVALRATGTVGVGTGTSITVAGKGFRLGSGVASGNNIRGSQGESYTGVGAAATSTANGGGGGGGELTNVGGDACGSGGAGGGYGASGSSGGYGSSCGGTLPANGPGAAYGVADLSDIFLGSGGGGGGKDEHSDANCPGNPASGDGADGGGTVVVLANTITVSGGVSANGNNGSTAPCLSDNGNGGGGSGGSVYLAAVNVTLGTNLVTATAGSGAASGGVWNGAGGNAGTGRIRVETGSVTSVTTNPSASLSANAPAGATFAFAQDTKYDFIPKNTIKRIRFEVSNEGGASTGAQTYQLQVAQTATCSSGTYAAVPTDTTGHWQIIASTYITDSNPTANIHLAGTQALTDENTTFVKGQLKDTGNTTGSITLATTEFTEIEFSVQALNAAVDNANYCFRLTNINTYTQYGEAVIVPEYTWVFFGVGPLLPEIIRRIRRRRK